MRSSSPSSCPVVVVMSWVLSHDAGFGDRNSGSETWLESSQRGGHRSGLLTQLVSRVRWLRMTLLSEPFTPRPMNSSFVSLENGVAHIYIIDH